MSIFHGYMLSLELFIPVYISYYLHLSKNIDSDQLCYIYLTSCSSPVGLTPGKSLLSFMVLLFSLVQKTSTKLLYKASFFILLQLNEQRGSRFDTSGLVKQKFLLDKKTFLITIFFVFWTFQPVNIYPVPPFAGGMKFGSQVSPLINLINLWMPSKAFRAQRLY